MASTAVYSSIKAFLQGQFAPIPVLDFDQIETAMQQQQNPFLVLQEVYALEDLIGIGDPTSLCIREESAVVVHAFVPAPESSAAVRTLAEQVQTAMRARQFPQVRVTRVSPPDLEGLNDGLWSTAGVSVDLQHDFHAPAP